MKHLDASAISEAIELWEHDRRAHDEAPYEVFRATHRREARYLWLLSRGLGPPSDVASAALRNLLAWGLIRPDATITDLGRRLLAAKGSTIGPDPFAADVSTSRFRW